MENLQSKNPVTKYFEVTVKEEIQSAKGRRKRASRKLLVEAASFSEAEQLVIARFHAAEITAIKLSRVHGVICSEREASRQDACSCNSSASFSAPAQKPSIAPFDETSWRQMQFNALNRAQRRALEREEQRKFRKKRLREIGFGVAAKSK